MYRSTQLDINQWKNKDFSYNVILYSAEHTTVSTEHLQRVFFFLCFKRNSFSTYPKAKINNMASGLENLC